MKLIQKLDSLPVSALIALFIISITAITSSSVALADQRNSNRNHAFSTPGKWSQNTLSSNYGFSNYINTRYRASNSRNNSFYPNQFNRFVQNQRPNNYFRSNNFRSSNYRMNNYRTNNYPVNHRIMNRDSWSVNLNFGNAPYRSGIGSNLQYNNAWNHFTPYPVINTHTRIITSQPTVVYVKESSPYSVPVVSRSSVSTTTYRSASGSRNSGTAGRNLLKDLQGNCFERSYDSRGRENRVQLPDTACSWGQ